MTTDRDALAAALEAAGLELDERRDPGFIDSDIEAQRADRLLATLAITRAAPEPGLREALESAIRLAEVIPHSADVEQAGMQAEVVIETLRAALAAPIPSEPDR